MSRTVCTSSSSSVMTMFCCGMNITGNGFLGPWSIPVRWRFRELSKQALLTPFFLLLEYKFVSIHLSCFPEVRKNFEKLVQNEQWMYAGGSGWSTCCGSQSHDLICMIFRSSNYGPGWNWRYINCLLHAICVDEVSRNQRSSIMPIVIKTTNKLCKKIFSCLTSL